MTITTTSFAAWLRAYFDAWRSNDPADVAALFAESAVYEYGPFREPAVGREQIVANWVANTNNPPDLRTSASVIGMRGRTGVARWRASFSLPSPSSARRELDGVLVVQFNELGECIHHREWHHQRELQQQG